MPILLFIAALAALIIVHECGHFFTAKALGIRVDEFGIGFPPRLFALKFGETEYSLNLLLFGGFVRIYGERVEDENGTAYDRRSFAGRSRLAQAGVVATGIIMNFLAAWVILSGLYLAGMPSAPDPAHPGAVQNIELTVVDVLPGSPAEKSGLQGGDKVESLQTGTTELQGPISAQAARDFIAAHQDESVILHVKRGGADRSFLARPEAGLIPDDPSRKALGVEFADVGVERLGFIPAFTEGGKLLAQETTATAQGLYTFFANIFLGHPNFADVSGPVGIAQVGAQAASEGLATLLLFAAFISINLAIINILPVPGLDGGRLLIILIEALRGQAVSARAYNRLMAFGFGLLVLLMLVVTYHDLAKIF